MTSVDWHKIRDDWEVNKPTLKVLAERHGVTLSAVKSRKTREGWGVATEADKVATKRGKLQPSDKEVATEAADGKNKATINDLKGKEKKRGGNPNPSYKFPKHNQAARKHGMYSKHIPPETMEIFKDLDGANPADLLWTQIKLQFASIIRAQQIMFVSDDKDHDKFKIEKGEFSTKYEMHTAWDKQAKFINAQSRAMSELRSLIRQYGMMPDEIAINKKRLEVMSASLDKTAAEISILKGDNKDTDVEDFKDAILEAAKRRKQTTASDVAIEVTANEE